MKRFKCNNNCLKCNKYDVEADTCRAEEKPRKETKGKEKD